MSTRRIVACACALALTIPAAASARPGFDAPVGPQTGQGVTYGSTQYDQQNQDLGTPAGKKADVYVPPGHPAAVSFTAVKGDTTANVYVPPTDTAPAYVAPKGDTKVDVAPNISQRHHVVVPAGKSGGSVLVTVPEKHTAPSAGAADDNGDGWQIAAIAEAGLIAAMAFAGAAFAGRRTRPQRTATA